MRILVLADIHANWPALEAIREPYDVCICLGDLVDYGVEPEPCVRWVRQNCQYAIRGNHDHAVAQNIVATGEIGYRLLARETRPLMWSLLGTEDKTYLARLPITLRITLDACQYYLVHATPRDPLDEFLLDDLVQWERRLQGEEANFVCVGHTHKQFLLKLNGCQLLNPGSVGQPRDGDPRAAYAVIEDGNVQLKRVEYDVERSIAALERAPISQESKLLAQHVLRTGGIGTTNGIGGRGRSRGAIPDDASAAPP
jgi:putative phosphoesterase